MTNTRAGEKREEFFTLDNIATQTNVVREYVHPTLYSGGPVLAASLVDDTHDYEGKPFGTVYYDESGDVFGVAGRVHIWNRTYNLTGSPTITGTSYSYSDDLCETFVDPNLGLITYNGDTDNNLVYASILLVTVDPDDTNFPVKAFLHNGNEVAGTGTLLKSADGLTFIDIEQDYGIVGDNNGFIQMHGEFWLFHHGLYNNSSPIAERVRLSCMDKTSDFYTPSWEYGNLAAHNVTSKAIPRNKTEDDGSNRATNLSYEDGIYEGYMGGGLAAELDITGAKIFLLDVRGKTREAPTVTISDGSMLSQLGTMGDITDSKYKLVSGDDEVMITPNGSTIVQAGMVYGLVETDTMLIGLYWYRPAHHNDALSAATAYNTNKCTWRKDGMVRMVLASGGNLVSTDVTKGAGNGLFINYNGSIKCELQDTNGDVIPGYSLAECDLVSSDETDIEVTWNGRQARGIPDADIKVRCTGTGDLYRYSFSAVSENNIDPTDPAVLALRSIGPMMVSNL